MSMRQSKLANEPLKGHRKRILNTQLYTHTSKLHCKSYIHNSQFTKTKVNIQDLEIPISRKILTISLKWHKKVLGINLI